MELRREGAVHPKRANHDAERRGAAGIHHRNADRLIEGVAVVGRLEPQALGNLPLHRSADQRAAREVFAEDAPPRRPCLQHAGTVGDEDPVGAGLAFELVGLVEEIGAITGAERLTDAGDVGGDLDQGLREPEEREASAGERLLDGGGGGAEGASGGVVGRRIGSPLGRQQRRAQHRHDDERGAEEDASAEGKLHRPPTRIPVSTAGPAGDTAGRAC